MKRLYTYLILLLIAQSCSFSTHYLQSGANYYPPTSPEMIKVYSGDIKVSYTVIGPVAASVSLNDGTNLLEKLQEEAASMGADAIIFSKLNEFTSFSANTGLSGVAIKFISKE
jgi:hypothetical protein